MHHELKTLHRFFEEVVSGKKTFEIRLNDRRFQAGDTVTLREIKPDPLEHYTGRFSEHRIGYVTDFHQMPGHVVFSLLPYTYDPTLD